MKAFGWLLRREVWEHRGLYLVPFILVAVLVVAYALVWLSPAGTIAFDIDGHSGEINIKEYLLEDPAARDHRRIAVGALPFVLPTVLVNAAMLILWFFYLTGTLYGERRDRSVLFWKSLPVSDTATVLSKFATAMVVIPLLSLAAILLAALAMAVVNTVVVWSAGHGAWNMVWSDMPLLAAPAMLGYGFAVQSLWYAPVFGWLLLTSAFAPRAPALWAVLPPLAITLLERLVLGSHHFAELLGVRLQPAVPTAFRDSDFEQAVAQGSSRDGDMNWSELIGALIDPQSFLVDPRLWSGLAVAAVFLAAAIWLRRYRDAF